MVLGLGFLFFFNHPDNPLNFVYKTMFILVLANIVHYYTVPHLTATTALKQLDTEFEISFSFSESAIHTNILVRYTANLHAGHHQYLDVPVRYCDHYRIRGRISVRTQHGDCRCRSP